MTGITRIRCWLLLGGTALLAAACQSEPAPPAPVNIVEASAATAAATSTATVPPSPTAPPTQTPTPTSTPTPTPTPHPLTIGAMRERSYPGSEFTIEQVLEPGSNYDRFVASYRSEGLKIYGLLTVPRGDPPPTGWPAIIFNHGYIPPTVYRTTERYVAYVDGFARSGYIVFKPDYRGHGDSEGEPSGAYGSPGYVVDVLNALASMRQYPPADPDRIGFWGHSMGGYITLRSMVITDTIKAGVIWAGVVGPYPNLFLRPTATPTPEGATPEPTPTGTLQFNRRWRLQLVETYGTPEENPDFWNSITSATYLNDLSGPIQLHHGTADSSVPLAASEWLYEQMLAAEEPVELFTYEGSDHNISVGFGLAMQRSIEFFDRYVKGE